MLRAAPVAQAFRPANRRAACPWGSRHESTRRVEGQPWRAALRVFRDL